MIESVLNYFQNSVDNLKYTEIYKLKNSSYHIHYCTRNPSDPKADPYFVDKDIPCLAQYGGFVDPNVALGGFQSESWMVYIHFSFSISSGVFEISFQLPSLFKPSPFPSLTSLLPSLPPPPSFIPPSILLSFLPLPPPSSPSLPPPSPEDENGYNYDTSTALFVTFIVNNHLGKDVNKMAETWEKAFLDYLHQYKAKHINITFSAEVHASASCTYLIQVHRFNVSYTAMYYAW